MINFTNHFTKHLTNHNDVNYALNEISRFKDNYLATVVTIKQGEPDKWGLENYNFLKGLPLIFDDEGVMSWFQSDFLRWQKEVKNGIF